MSRLLTSVAHRIYTLEKEVNQRNQTSADDAEVSPLLDSVKGDPDKAFSQALSHELQKITDFYHTKESEVFTEVENTLKDGASFLAELGSIQESQDGGGSPVSRRRSLSGTKSRQGNILGEWGFPKRRRISVSRPILGRIDSDDSDEEADERTMLKRSKTGGSARSFSMQDSGLLESSRLGRKPSAGAEENTDGSTAGISNSAVIFKKRMISLYVSLCELKSFVQLNQTGFSKVLKKYDKIMDKSLKQTYIENNISNSPVFKQEATDSISDRVVQVEEAYANLATQGDIDQAKRELRLDLREHVVWERNTVWREMIGIERKAQAANLGIRRTILGGDGDPNKRHRQGDEESDITKEVETPVGRYRCPQFVLNPTFYVLISALVIFVLLLVIPIMEMREQQNCLAMVVFVSFLWATEVSQQTVLSYCYMGPFNDMATNASQAIPLFVTSLLIPFLAVVLKVVRTDQEPHDRMNTKAAASYVFSAMWTPVIMLLLGGFTIAAALSKYNIAKMMATFVLSKAGTRPRNVLLTSMFVSMFASMWISNVAAPVLCFSIVQVNQTLGLCYSMLALRN